MPQLETLLEDPSAYISGIGNGQDAIVQALQTGGENTAIRFCFGATTEAPFRSLGYIAAGAHLAETYFPESQLQFVFTPNTGERVNGIPQEESAGAIEAIRDIAHLSVLAYFTDLRGDRVTFLRDTTEELPSDVVSHMKELISGHPAEERLAASAQRRGTDHIAYLAAHIMMQYTHGTVHSLEDEPRPLEEPDLLINVGSHSDLPFHDLIDESKRKGLIIPNAANTARLTTRHRLPPYITCNEGEPSILEPPMHKSHRNSDVKRALRHITGTVRERAKLQSQQLYALD
jgi:hypothetical protein